MTRLTLRRLAYSIPILIGVCHRYASSTPNPQTEGAVA
jgi:hypothetical protein